MRSCCKKKKEREIMVIGKRWRRARGKRGDGRAGQRQVKKKKRELLTSKSFSGLRSQDSEKP